MEKYIAIGSKDYLYLVKKEIRYLKKNASRKELLRLNFKKLNPLLSRSCIYGQMTDSCYSDRARELIQGLNATNSFVSIKRGESYIVPKPPRMEKWENFTFLEHFILNYRENNENILKYLRDEEKYLKIKIEK